MILSLVAIVAPLATEANATHGACDIDIREETDTNPTGTTHQLTAVLVESGATQDDTAAACNDPRATAVNVDFEIDGTTDCAGSTYTGETGGTAEEPCVDADQAPGTNDDIRAAAVDMQCTIPVNNAGSGTLADNSCTVSYSRSDAGTDLITGWVDEDNSDATDDSATESDTVTKIWQDRVGTTLDCDDESGDDTQTNPTGQSEMYTCTVRDQFGDPVATDWHVFGEVENGVNDPDDPDASSYDDPDQDYGPCHTIGDGDCTITITANESENGAAEICFWAQLSNVASDGDVLCATEPTAEAEQNDLADQVVKTWEAPEATSINCEPEGETNSIGESHTITCTVSDQFGATIAGVNVDGEVLAGSPNDPQNDGTAPPPDYNNLGTNASGQASVTYSGTTAGTDTFCFWIDDNGNDLDINDGAACPAAGTAPGSADTVTKTWQTGQADELNCEPETDANLRDSSHTVTCFSANEGQLVRVEATGANDPDGNNDFANPDFTCTITGGQCQFTHSPTQDNVGVTLYRAWVGNAPDATEGRDEDNAQGSTLEGDNTDVVEKRWHGVAQTLTQTPDSDAAALGTCNVFTVTLTDASNPTQPVGNATIDIRQTHANFNNGNATDDADLGFCTAAEVAAADPSAPNPSDVTIIGGNGSTGQIVGETDEDTDANGQVSYGIEVDNNTGGTVTVLAFCEEAGECPNVNDNETPEPSELQDQSTKNWGAGGADGVENVVCTPETDTNPANTIHRFQCTLTNQQGSAVPGVTPTADITAGPNANEVGATPTCDASDSNGVSRCEYDDAGASPLGTDTIEIWVQQSAASGGGTAGRDAGEPFDTVSKTWQTPPVGLILNLTCDDSNGPSKDATADDDLEEDLDDEWFDGAECQNPLTSTSETFTALVTDPRGTGTNRDDVGVAGIQVEFTIPDDFQVCFFGCFTVDGEDPADIGFVPPGGGSNGPVYCTTGADGRCSVTVTNPTPETFDYVFVQANIFGQESEGTFGNSEDAADKEWLAAGVPANVVVTPQGDTNQTGTQHSVVATVTDVFNNPVQGVNVDFDIDEGSRNDPNADPDPIEGLDRITNAQGQATFTYNDTGSLTADGEDNFTVWADTNPEDDQLGNEPSDTARKLWQTQPGSPTSMRLDMQMDDDLSTDDCPDNIGAVGANAFPFAGFNDNAVGANSVSTNFPHEICAVAFDQTNRVVVGGSITFTITGPGVFEDLQGNDIGKTVTVAVDQDGHAHARINSTETGTTTVAASSGNVTDTGTKEWVSQPPRTLDCEPETGVNDPSEQHLVQCTARDAQGNPVAGWYVYGTSSGVGRIQPTGGISCDPSVVGSPNTCIQITDGNGVAPFTLENPSQVEGTQSVTFELADDDNDAPGTGTQRASQDVQVDECERPAGNPAGAPAGICTDTISKTWQEGGQTTTATVTEPPPGGFQVDITLDADKPTRRYGRQFNLTGSLTPIEANTPNTCVSAREVILERVVTGTTTVVEVARTTTDASGIFSFTLEADKSATYVARVEPIGPAGDETCADAQSAGEEVRVKKAVSLRFKKKRVPRGKLVRLRVVVRPCGAPDGQGHAGQRATLWKAVAGTMARVGSKKTNDNCVANFFRRIRRPSVYQGRSPKQDADHQRGQSNKRAIQIRRR